MIRSRGGVAAQLAHRLDPYRARNRPFRVVVEEVVPQMCAVPAAVLGDYRELHERGDASEDADVGQSHGVTYRDRTSLGSSRRRCALTLGTPQYVERARGCIRR